MEERPVPLSGLAGVPVGANDAEALDSDRMPGTVKPVVTES